MKKLFILILVLVLTALPILSLAASSSDTVRYVYTGNSGRLNVRSTPYAPADNLITRLDNGTEVTVVSSQINQSWSYIRFKLGGKDVTGYVQSRYLVTTKPIVITQDVNDVLNFKKFKHVTPYTATVKPSTPGGFVNMRWAPSKATDVMTKLYADAQVTVIAKNSSWAQIYDPLTGYVGYMMLSFLI